MCVYIYDIYIHMYVYVCKHMNICVYIYTRDIYIYIPQRRIIFPLKGLQGPIQKPWKSGAAGTRRLSGPQPQALLLVGLILSNVGPLILETSHIGITVG